MKKTLLAGSGILALCIFPTVTQAESKADLAARKAIQIALDRQAAAFARKDLKGTYACYAPDYSRVDLQGKTYHLADDERFAAGAFAHLKSIKTTTTIQKVTVAGGKATVDLTVHALLTLSDIPSPGKNLKINDTDVRHQIWVHRHGWLLQYSKSLSNKQVSTPGP